MTFKQLLEQNEFVLLDGAMGTSLQKSGLGLGEIPELLNITNPALIQQIHSRYIDSGAQIIYTNTFGANGYKLANCGYTPKEIILSAVNCAKKARDNANLTNARDNTKHIVETSPKIPRDNANLTIENCPKNARDNTKHTVETSPKIPINNTNQKDNKNVLIALDLGPIGALMQPSGSLSFDEAYNYFKEQILAASDVDVVVIETMTDLLEMKSAVLAAKENCTKPILCTMTFEKNMRTFSGCPISAMATMLQSLGVDAIGVNCSLGSDELFPIIEELSKWTSLPIIAKPNAGLPNPETNEYSIVAKTFADDLLKLIPLGVKIFGGCCGSDETYIEAIKNNLIGKKFVNITKELPSAVCSGNKTVVISEPKIVGERINPTGKKLFKQALLNNDIDYILSQALQQISAGADILDVNVGLPEIDEKSMMLSVVKALQSVVSCPLQIDSNIPDVLEATLRIYSGKPIVNSVNGEEESMNNILPLAKKYGAAIVCLTIDKNGIPTNAEQRFSIAKNIVQRATKIGIDKKDIFVDCLTLTASAEQYGVLETLKALSRVKNELGVKTILGVSNVSFGLPNRELINQTFLTMALSYGLDLAIINPNIAAMSDAVRTFNLLANNDKGANKYIAHYNETNSLLVDKNAQSSMPLTNNLSPKSVTNNVSNASQNSIGNNASFVENNIMNMVGNNASFVENNIMNMVGNNASFVTENNNTNCADDLSYAIQNGLKNECKTITKNLLLLCDELDIINNNIIPALDKVGILFEQGKLFLPQLIQSATAAEACFSVIKEKLILANKPSQSKGTIILATVKGDMHDIGKNIVKVLLENYGYTIIDLGKDVACQAVVDAAIKYKSRLVGLSALMTTTVKSMQQTIKLLRENNVDCAIFVGGAVLTKEYALSIGADYYCKDAKESVDVAKKIFS